MPRYDLELSDYERLIRRRYKFVLIVALVVTVLAVVVARLRPMQYRATAAITIDRNIVWTPGGSGAEIYGQWDNIQTQMQEITSFPVLIRAAKRLGSVPQDASEDVVLTDESVLTMLDEWARTLKIEKQPTANVVTISALASTPQQAQEMANAIMLAYKEYSFQRKKLAIEKTRVLVQGQLQRTVQEIAVIDSQMMALQRRQVVPSLDESIGKLFTRQKELDLQRDALRVGISSIEMQKEKLVEHYVQRRSAAQRGAEMPPRYQEWIADHFRQDHGLEELNNRIIRQQMELDEMLRHYTRSHPSVVSAEKAIERTVQEMIAVLDKHLGLMRNQLRQADTEYAQLDRQLREIPGSRLEAASLQRDLRVKDELRRTLAAKLDDIMIVETGLTEDVSITYQASAPQRPINDITTQVAGIGLVLGLILGFMGALVREMLDTSIYGVEDIERAFDIDVVGVVPRMRIGTIDVSEGYGVGRREKKIVQQPDFHDQLSVHFAPRHLSAEAFRILRTNIDARVAHRPGRILVVSSASTHEGKSLISANLALAYAQSGLRVLLIECDMRVPGVSPIFGMAEDDADGLAQALGGGIPWRQCVRTITDLMLGTYTFEDVRQTPGLDNLTIMPVGRRPDNPAELLSSPAMRSLLDEAQKEFDLIMLDTPPILPVADSLILARRCDGIVLVYRSGKAPRNALRLTLERLDAIDAPIVGVVLNDMRPEQSDKAFLQLGLDPEQP